jgi:putative transposase
MQQKSFFKTKSKHRYCHGGSLRKQRAGRGMRVLSTKEPLHLVFKANKPMLKFGLRSHKCFRLIHFLIRKYAKRFFIKIEQVSLQNDHIHFVIRTTRRSNYHHFFRVVAGQIAQEFGKHGYLKEPVTDTPKNQGKLWKHRPFSRVIRGFKAFKTAMDYVRLNEKEARGEIKYRKERLKGLRDDEWEALWV